MKKFLINATNLSSGRMEGINRYGIELTKKIIGSCPSATAFTSHADILRDYGATGRVHESPPVLSESNFKGNLSRLMWNQLVLPRLISKENFEIYFSMVPEGMLAPRCKQVITIHDTLPLVYPEIFPRLRHYFRWVVPRLMRKSAAVIVVSNFIREELKKFYDVGGVPLHVIHQGYRSEIFFPRPQAEVEAIKKKLELDKYFLCVGETRPYKNIRRLIEAFSRLESPMKLVIVGSINKYEKDLLQLPIRLNLGDKVRFLGYVNDDDLARLYSGARAFVFPTLYEGFGIPLLEAMACGCPIAASRVASLPEVGGDAALYFNPYDHDDIRNSLQKLIDGPGLGEELRDRGKERVKHFDYVKTAADTLSLLNEVGQN